MHKNILKLFKKPEKKEYDKEQLAEGIKVEMEHTDDPEVAKTIASHHLDEDSDYYKKLKIMERVKLSDLENVLLEVEEGDHPFSGHHRVED